MNEKLNNKNAKAHFVLSKKIAIAQYDKIKSLVDRVSYSLKTNYDVAQVLEKETDSDFSVHSIKELNFIKDKKRCLFFAQGWNDSDIKRIIDLSCNSFVVDNQSDLDVLLNFLKNRDIMINIFLRMRLKEHTVHTGKHFVFGFYSDKINELIPILRENKNIKLLGVHFHRKTQNVSEWSLKQELEQTLDKSTLEKLDYVNIGGGIPYIYKNFRTGVINSIFGKIQELREFLKSYNIQVIAEPGRFIAAPSVKLLTYINNVYDDNIIVNCSIYNSAMDTFIANIRLLVQGELEEKDQENHSKKQNKGYPFTIKGITPDSMDIFRYKVHLKEVPKVGDEIIFLNAGAYNFSTEFCKLEKLETVIVD